MEGLVIATREVGGVIIRRQFLNNAEGGIRANNPDILEKLGATVKLTDRQARDNLTTFNWSKRK